MNRIPQRTAKPAETGLLPQVLIVLTVGLFCTLLFFTNVGCEMSDALTTYAIELSPPYFTVEAPGQQGVVKATLMWSTDLEVRELEAKTWTIDPGLPPVLESSDWAPKQTSIYTDITLKCSSDESRFVASDLWTASKNSAYLVGVKASFVEPVWKSVSGGQDVTITRKAFLPLRVGTPIVHVRQTSVDSNGSYLIASFSFETENPLEGWRYRVRAYARDIYKVTGEVQNYADHQVSWTGAGGATIPGGIGVASSDDQRACYVICEIEYLNNLGKLVRSETKVFNY